MIRVLMVVLVVGGLTGGIMYGMRFVLANDERTIPATVVKLSETGDGATLVDYAVRDGETLVLRILNRSDRDCLFRIFYGPKRGNRTVEAGLVVDYRVVSAGSAKSTWERMSEPCQDFWISHDR